MRRPHHAKRELGRAAGCLAQDTPKLAWARGVPSQLHVIARARAWRNRRNRERHHDRSRSSLRSRSPVALGSHRAPNLPRGARGAPLGVDRPLGGGERYPPSPLLDRVALVGVGGRSPRARRNSDGVALRGRGAASSCASSDRIGAADTCIARSAPLVASHALVVGAREPGGARLHQPRERRRAPTSPRRGREARGGDPRAEAEARALPSRRRSPARQRRGAHHAEEVATAGAARRAAFRRRRRDVRARFSEGSPRRGPRRSAGEGARREACRMHGSRRGATTPSRPLPSPRARSERASCRSPRGRR